MDPMAPENPKDIEAPENRKDPEDAVDRTCYKNDFHVYLIRRASHCISLMKDLSYFSELVTQHLS